MTDEAAEFESSAVARALYRFGAEHHRWVLAGALLATVGAAVFSTQVRFTSAVDIWFVEDDPTLETYREFIATFDADEVTVVGLFADDANVALEPYADVARTRIAQISGVGRVRPHSNRGSQNEGLATALLVDLTRASGDFEDKIRLVQAMRAALEVDRPPGVSVIIAGTPAVNEAVFRYAQRDFRTLGIVALALIIILGWLTLGRLSLALLPLASVVLAIVWLLGLMGALGISLNLISQSIPTVLFAIGVADAIHLLSALRTHSQVNAPRAETAARAAEAVFLPCAITTLTTAAGLISVTTSRLRPIAEFGWLAAVGVIFAFGAALIVLPALLVVLPSRPPRQADRIFLDAPLEKLLALPRARPRAVLVLAALVTAAATLGVSQLEVGANPLGYFHSDDPVRREIARVDAELGGSSAIELFVRAPDSGLRKREVLQALFELETFIETLPAVAQVHSVSQALAAVNEVMTGTIAIPATPEQIAQAYLLLEQDGELGHIVNDDFTRARISARIRMSDAAVLVDELPRINQHIARARIPGVLEVEPTGFVKMISEMEIYIVDSQVESLSIAFVIVTLLMLAFVRSFSRAWLAVIPNVAPVLAGLGAMGLLGIKLDPGTAMIGSITLGLVVDDTVHVLAGFNRAVRHGATPANALESAIRQSGPAIAMTSVILIGGFGALAFGSFTPNVNLGLIASLIIGLALFFDLLVLPALVYTVWPDKR